jgi:gas vesicle protein
MMYKIIIVTNIKIENQKGNKMKLLKVITLAMLGFFLVNCDNSKSTTDDIKQKSEQTGSEMSDKAGQLGSEMGDKAGQLGSEMSDKASKLGSQIEEKAEQLSSQVSDKASQLGAKVSEQVKQVSSAVSDKAQDLYEQTKSEKDDMLNKVREGHYGVAQDLMLKAIKTKLPATMDSSTTLVDVSAENNTINYKYNVNNITKDALQNESTQKEVKNNLIEFYCGDSASMKTLRLVFPRGANHNYYINNDKVFSVDVKPSDCEDD